MPDWWIEAALPAVVFGALFVLWVVLPPPAGEVDLGSRVRDLVEGASRNLLKQRGRD